MDCFTFEDFSRFLFALKYTAGKHRSQRRKDAARTPFVNHPVEVAELLWRAGEVRDMTVLVAALLHDVVEDTETGPEEIRDLFGKDVLAIVLEVTDDKNLSRTRRKELQVLHAPHLSPGAGLVKIADKICNVRDIAWSPPLDWSRQRRAEYLTWAEEVVNGVRTYNRGLDTAFRNVLAEGRKELEKA
ncbi:MAG: HD domain-containing protein [Desulfobacteraceae bacterium]|nr:HD domain-containing protein [Desulfobacteraceae bacterium]